VGYKWQENCNHRWFIQNQRDIMTMKKSNKQFLLDSEFSIVE